MSETSTQQNERSPTVGIRYIFQWSVAGASLIGFLSIFLAGSLAYKTGTIDHCPGDLSCPGMIEAGFMGAATWGWSPEIILLELALLLIVPLAAPHQIKP